MNRSHFNTTHESGAKLDDYEGKARSQEDLILGYFMLNYPHARSPSQVQERLGLHYVPLTSIRRAMTNLTTRGKLEKTDQKVKGQYGRPEYCWRLVRRPGEQLDFF